VSLSPVYDHWLRERVVTDPYCFAGEPHFRGTAYLVREVGEYCLRNRWQRSQHEDFPGLITTDFACAAEWVLRGNGWDFYEPDARERQKQASRDADAATLASGEKTREQLRAENGFRLDGVDWEEYLARLSRRRSNR
jgi:uncharacterized protein (DUF433 family)